MAADPITDFRSLPEQELMQRAVRVLQGEQTPQETIYRLARALKNRWKRFGMARKLLWLARADSSRVTARKTNSDWMRKLCQQHALCTYKDQDLPAYVRFDRALKILREEDLRDQADASAPISQETLGIAGAIFKAQWEAFGQRRYLHQSLAYYARGWRQGSEDDGYTGINTAYLLDLIAFQEDSEARGLGEASPEAARRREEALNIRSQLAAKLPAAVVAVEKDRRDRPLDDPDKAEERLDRLYWLLVSLGEIYVGLGLSAPAHLEQATSYYLQARELNRYDWMTESTARQLASLIRLLRPASATATNADEGQVMRALVGGDAPGVQGAFVGKVGLALSGGGFRASLFHIGVLARLAELDMLRHIEYLSCVSGGSIIGAYYYLEIRRLLQEKTDGELKRDDYVEIVKHMEVNFLAGVQQNLRMLALADYPTNLKHDMLSGALPTEFVAELYESLLYSRTGVEAADGDPGLFVSELFICPCILEDGQRVPQTNFRPKDDNWRRRNKAPILVLNATTLNTGHNWQFTATWMGEPPATINNEIDANQRLRRMYYSEAPNTGGANYQRFRLGRAVGASACVPGLFVPVEMAGLYKDINVRLVDGGVHDNQGVSSLLEQGCTAILVSDASGQLADAADPTLRIANTAMRADEIAQERVRVAEYSDLESRHRSGLLRSLMFIHLKKDIDLPPKDWVNCPLPYRSSEEAKPATDLGPLTSYGVNREVQRKLAAVRTDLDAFHETEAWALMTSGYRMVEFHFPDTLREATVAPLAGPRPWKFICALNRMAEPEPNPEFLALLDRSSQRFFKIWDMVPALGKRRGQLKLAAACIVIALLAITVWLLLAFPIYMLIAAGLAVVLALVIKSRMKHSIAHMALAFAFARFAQWYLKNFNQLYLDAGRWKP